MSGSVREYFRLADLLAALSVVTDLGIGRPPEAAMRACLLATRLAGAMDLPSTDVADIYYATLLRYIGCTAYAHEEAALVGGDELSARATITRTDYRNVREALGTHLRLAHDAPLMRRTAVAVTSLPRLIAGTKAMVSAHCEVGTAMVRRLGMTVAVQAAMDQIFERWDGKGFPDGLRGDRLCLPVRFAHVATQVIAFESEGGYEVVESMVRERADGWFDPAIADAFLLHGRTVLDEIMATDAWTAVVEAEPEPHLRLGEVGIDRVADAFADMADLKTFFTRGHSRMVADLSATAMSALHADEVEVRALRRAALFHDLGRVGVPNGIWEKRGALTALEWEQVRLHPYHTERILSRAPALSSIGRVAGMHHERQDGSGYYRQLSGSMVPISARVLAAADAYVAMTHQRPYRDALHAPDAVVEMQTEVQAGRLDAEAVRAVLEATGHRQRRRIEHPAGLSDREVEVLRLIATGSTYREVAQTLTISPRTAAHHVQHIYNKIGVSSRAAAAMFAMEHDLLGR